MPDNEIVFDHIHLISDDPQVTSSWYAEKLGGEITDRLEIRGTPQFVVTFNGVTIFIRGRRTGEELCGSKDLQWRTNHFGFHVNGDFDEFCDKLRQKGVVFTLDPVDFRPTVRIAFIEAPDGVSIELLQRKD
ncbi:MAG: VOC family protein [Deltaproteobacteria bacterium]|nr:VOC family protein [Deltaproteobacteria bacterium]